VGIEGVALARGHEANRRLDGNRWPHDHTLPRFLVVAYSLRICAVAGDIERGKFDDRPAGRAFSGVQFAATTGAAEAAVRQARTTGEV